MSKRGFSLMEIIIVTAVIGLLSGIAFPNFVKARENAIRAACKANLKRIQAAVQMWALETSAGTNATPDYGDLTPSYIKTWPKCGELDYEIPSVGAAPVCPAVAMGHAIDS